MIPAAFDYKRATSAAEAISLVSQYGDDAKFLAGGHSLIPLMKLRLAQPGVLVDIGRLNDLSYITDKGDHIAIGALTRHMRIENCDLLKKEVPLLAHAASHVGDAQVRHRGTIGGSIAHADSASDLPATSGFRFRTGDGMMPRVRIERGMEDGEVRARVEESLQEGLRGLREAMPELRRELESLPRRIEVNVPRKVVVRTVL